MQSMGKDRAVLKNYIQSFFCIDQKYDLHTLHSCEESITREVSWILETSLSYRLGSFFARKKAFTVIKLQTWWLEGLQVFLET